MANDTSPPRTVCSAPVGIQVHSSQLQFTRDGRGLVIAEPDGVTLYALRGDSRRRISIPGVHAVAAFAEQVWVVVRRGALIRLAGDGRQLDEHAIPADPEGVLIPTMIGGPAAHWIARESVMLVDDLGTLAIIPTEVDSAIPTAGRRFAKYAGARLTLPAGRLATLEHGARITGGSVVFDGTSIALLTEHARGRDIVVLTLASGRILGTMPLPPGMVRIAARRGVAVVHDAPRRLAVIDLRFARHVGAILTDDDVTDVAIDPDGSLLAIRLGSGELELAHLGERIGLAAHPSAFLRDPSHHDVNASKPERVDSRVAETPPEVEPSEARPEALACSTPLSEPRLANAQPAAPRAAEPPAAEPLPAEPPSPDILTSAVRPSAGHASTIADAFDPRVMRTQLSREAALVELDREIRSVCLWALCAIACAWDTQRLGYGDEGHHPYEHEVAALVGMNAGFAPDHLAAAQERTLGARGCAGRGSTASRLVDADRGAG